MTDAEIIACVVDQYAYVSDRNAFARTILSALTAAGRVIVDAGEVARLTAERDEFADLVMAYAEEKRPDAMEILGADRDKWLKRTTHLESLLQEAGEGLEPLSRLSVMIPSRHDDKSAPVPVWHLRTAHALATKIAALLPQEKPHDS